MKRTISKTRETCPSTEYFADFLKNEDGSLISFDLNCDGTDKGNCEKDEICDSPNKKIKISEEKIIVKKDVISSWVKLLKENLPDGLKELTEGLRAGVCFADSADAKFNKYEVPDVEIRKSIVNTCTTEMIPTLKKYLSLLGAKAKNSLPSSSHKWKNVKPTVEAYLTCALKLLDDPEADSLAEGLRHLAEMMQFYACFKDLTRALIEKLVKLWEESPEVLTWSGECLGNLLEVANDGVSRMILWRLHLALMRHCTSKSKSHRLSESSQSLARLYCVKPKVACVVMGTYLDRMHKVIDSVPKKKDAAKMVVCDWQFFCSLSVWAEVVRSRHEDEEKIRQLMVPLVNLVLKLIGLNVSPIYYPLRNYFADVLLELARSTGFFVPSLLSVIIEPLKWRLFQDGADNENLASFKFGRRLVVTKEEVSDRMFLEATFNEVVHLLLRFAVAYSGTVNFPSLADEVVKQAKLFKETCIVPKFVKKLEQVATKMKAISDRIERKRRTDATDLKDRKALAAWETTLKDEGKDLQKLLDSWYGGGAKQGDRPTGNEEKVIKKEEKNTAKTTVTKTKVVGRQKPEADSSDSESDVEVDDDDDDDGGKDENGEIFYEDDDEPLAFEE